MIPWERRPEREREAQKERMGSGSGGGREDGATWAAQEREINTETWDKKGRSKKKQKNIVG